MKDEIDIIADETDEDQENVSEMPNKPIFYSVDCEEDCNDIISYPKLCADIEIDKVS